MKRQHDFMWDYLKDLSVSMLRPATGFLVIFAFTVMAFGALLIFLAERGTNPQFSHYFDALYFAVTVMTTVGLGDIHPITILGKALTMLYMVVGAGIFVSFTAVISTSIMQIEANRTVRKNTRSGSDAGPDLP